MEIIKEKYKNCDDNFFIVSFGAVIQCFANDNVFHYELAITDKFCGTSFKWLNEVDFIKFMKLTKTSSSSEIENLVVKIDKNGNFECLTGYNDVVSFFKQFEYLPIETFKNLKFVL